MKLNCIIYTTSRSPWFSADLDMVKGWLGKTKGRDEVSFAVKHIRAPKKIETVVDSDGHRRMEWEWFEKRFVEGLNKGYTAVGFHFTTKERDAWKLSKKIRGTYHRNSDDILDFWLCADRGEKAKNYPYSNFARILVHEISHGDVHWTEADRGLVHTWDYELHKIHDLPAEIIYTEKWNTLSNFKDSLLALLGKK